MYVFKRINSHTIEFTDDNSWSNVDTVRIDFTNMTRVWLDKNGRQHRPPVPFYQATNGDFFLTNGHEFITQTQGDMYAVFLDAYNKYQADVAIHNMLDPDSTLDVSKPT
jgi:hypothetical protein